jgi:hypothetical protein
MGNDELATYGQVMASLHIQHPITDLPTWLSAFSGFAERRRLAGVLSESVRHPVGDDRFVVIDLDFGTVDEATAFLHFLETTVWAIDENSPALSGTPHTNILERVNVTLGASE